MIIRKLFRFEGAHIVRDCYSDYCKKSVHGHSYTVEIFLRSSVLDNACMVMDFGLLKPMVKDVIESFDHAWSFWDREKEDYKEFVKSHSERWVEMPLSPSAEGYALILYYLIDMILGSMIFSNGEKGVGLEAVRVHETATGYAETDRYDADMRYMLVLESIIFSDAIKKAWADPEMFEKIKTGQLFIMDSVNLEYGRLDEHN